MTQQDWKNWQPLEPGFKVVAVGVNPDQRLDVFSISEGGALFHNFQKTASDPEWSGWQRLTDDKQFRPTALAVANNQDGRLEAHCIGLDGALYGVAPEPGSSDVDCDWSKPILLGTPPNVGAPLVSVSVGMSNVVVNAGHLEAVATDTEGKVWRIGQVAQNGGWGEFVQICPPSSNVEYAVDHVLVATNSLGLLEAIGAGQQPRDNGQFPTWRISQAGDDSWKFEQDIQDFKPPSDKSLKPGIRLAATNAPPKSKLLRVFISGDGHLYQARESLGISDLHSTPLEPPQPGEEIQSIAAILNQDDLIQLFIVQSGVVWTTIEIKGDKGQWDGWMPLGSPIGATISCIAAGKNEDGRLEVFAPDSNGVVVHISEVSVHKVQEFKNHVKQLAPIVFMHPEEKFMPSSFDDYLKLTTYVDENGTNLGPLTEKIVEQPSRGRDGYLTYPWNDSSIRAGDVNSAVCYAHVTARSDGLPGYDVQYWFFSPFNGPGGIGLQISSGPLEWTGNFSLQPFGEHEGDWEHIAVRVDPNWTIHSVFYSQHSGGTWYQQASKPGAHDGYTLENGHPVVFSALNGHPSYPWAGAFPTFDSQGRRIGISVDEGPASVVAGLINFTKDGGARWDCSKLENHRLLAIDTPQFSYSSETWWLPFMGRVGLLNPDIGDRAKEAESNLLDDLEQVGKLTVIRPLLGEIAAAVITTLEVAAPFLDDPKGPTCLAEKDDWRSTPQKSSVLVAELEDTGERAASAGQKTATPGRSATGAAAATKQVVDKQGD